ncbi:MAG TPA: ATP-binding protein, partial [Parvularculaceae bacterium]|nr:ATP-binding protein [Parvularculaceae bacterium]
HFLAMLGYDYHFERGVDISLTALSALIAIVLTGAAFAYSVSASGRHVPFVAGPIMGAAIAVMHYTGMSAYAKSALLKWDYDYVAASWAIGIILSTVMFGLFLRSRTETAKITAAVALVLGICGLHFTGMTALTIVPLGGEPSGVGLSRESLAFAVIGATMTIMLVSMTAASFDMRLATQKEGEAEKLRALMEELREARDKAESANRAKSDFLANMSHEIRTPMNGVIGIAEILLNSNLGERERELASIIVSSGNSLMRVINDILDFSKLEAGKLRLVSEGFNLRQMIGEIGSMMQARALERDVELIVRYAPSAPEGVVGDENRLRQVISNIAGNAIKFTERGHVCIDVQGVRRADTADLTIKVVDTGIGIAPEQLPRMFQKFEQADTSKSRRYEGTGLGLAISKELIELMGGTISASSELGKGSTFTITLSLPADDNVATLPVADQSLFENISVLAVDDNAVNRRLLHELISAWGMRVVLAASASEARDAIDRATETGEPFDIILTDYQMPQQDGDQFVAHAQKDKRLAETPFIMLSSVDILPGKTSESSARYAAWLTKPVKASRLMDAMARALSDRAARRLNAAAGRDASGSPQTL